MNIPFLENMGEVDIDDEEGENETEYKHEEHSSLKNEVVEEEHARYGSVLPKGNVSAKTFESDPEMTEGNAKISEGKKIKKFHSPEGEKVVMIKAEDDKKLEYVRLVKLVELCHV